MGPFGAESGHKEGTKFRADKPGSGACRWRDGAALSGCVTRKRTTLVRSPSTDYGGVLADVVGLVDAARRGAVRSVNAIMTATYWAIGRRAYREMVQTASGESPVAEGPKKVQTASGQLASRDDVATVANHLPLPWSQYVRLLAVRNPEARRFYETEALRGGWTIRQLDRQIGSQFYERTILSKNKAAMLRRAVASPGDALTPEEEIKDPYLLEFLALKDEYSESDLEAALIAKLEAFLLELGSDFTFAGRQRRLRVGDEWYRIDLLFFHRRLRCLIIIDLKLDKLTHADAGQMHLYLNYAREHWTALPNEQLLVQAIEKTRKQLETRRRRRPKPTSDN
jgi:predicted nuclease of restriction endonuclease-like (RecB) superfamily